MGGRAHRLIIHVFTLHTIEGWRKLSVGAREHSNRNRKKMNFAGKGTRAGRVRNGKEHKFLNSSEQRPHEHTSIDSVFKP